MKVSDITLDMIKTHANYFIDEDDAMIQVMLDSAKHYIRSYTGLTDEEIDKREDLSIAALSLITDMIDNRQYTVDYASCSKVVDSILNLHCVNLL